jgi:hypothetical protein
MRLAAIGLRSGEAVRADCPPTSAPPRSESGMLVWAVDGFFAGAGFLAMIGDPQAAMEKRIAWPAWSRFDALMTLA